MSLFICLFLKLMTNTENLIFENQNLDFVEMKLSNKDKWRISFLQN